MNGDGVSPVTHTQQGKRPASPQHQRTPHMPEYASAVPLSELSGAATPPALAAHCYPTPLDLAFTTSVDFEAPDGSKQTKVQVSKHDGNCLVDSVLAGVLAHPNNAFYTTHLQPMLEATYRQHNRPSALGPYGAFVRQTLQAQAVAMREQVVSAFVKNDPRFEAVDKETIRYSIMAELLDGKLSRDAFREEAPKVFDMYVCRQFLVSLKCVLFSYQITVADLAFLGVVSTPELIREAKDSFAEMSATGTFKIQFKAPYSAEQFLHKTYSEDDDPEKVTYNRAASKATRLNRLMETLKGCYAEKDAIASLLPYLGEQEDPGEDNTSKARKVINAFIRDARLEGTQQKLGETLAILDNYFSDFDGPIQHEYPKLLPAYFRELGQNPEMYANDILIDLIAKYLNVPIALYRTIDTFIGHEPSTVINDTATGDTPLRIIFNEGSVAYDPVFSESELRRANARLHALSSHFRSKVSPPDDFPECVPPGDLD